MLHPVAVAGELYELALVQEPVQQGCAQDFIRERPCPFHRGLVRRDDERGRLVHRVDEGEQKVALVAVHGDVHDVVYHYDLCLGQRLVLLFRGGRDVLSLDGPDYAFH